MVKEALLVGTGGFVGSACRYLISMALAGVTWIHPIQLGTLAVNIVGSLLIGFFLAVLSGGHWYYLAVAGFCGGFTTFSAFSAELLSMLRAGHFGHGILYIMASVLVCLLAVWAGMYIGEAITGTAKG